MSQHSVALDAMLMDKKWLSIERASYMSCVLRASFVGGGCPGTGVAGSATRGSAAFAPGGIVNFDVCVCVTFDDKTDCERRKWAITTMRLSCIMYGNARTTQT